MKDTKETSNRWHYKKQENKRSSEYPHTLKSGGKSCTRKCQQFQEYEEYS